MALRGSGFSGAELILCDHLEPHITTTVFVSKFVPSEGPATRDPILNPATSRVQLLYNSSQAPALLFQISRKLERRGTRVEMASLGDAAGSISPNAPVVNYLDELNLSLDADEEQLERFKDLVSSFQSLLLLTSGGIAKGRNPDTSFVSGLLRTLKPEKPGIRFMSVDVDDFEPVNENLVRCLVDLASGLQQYDVGKRKDSEGFGWRVILQSILQPVYILLSLLILLLDPMCPRSRTSNPHYLLFFLLKRA